MIKLENDKKIWLSSDFHFFHNREFIYKPRGFSSIYEHDEAIIENWNRVVGIDDVVFHLGDVMLGDNEYGMKCLNSLKGHIHIICGNHCTNTRRALYTTAWNVVDVKWADVIDYKKHHFFLSHYPTLTGNRDLDKPLKAQVINLCGHSHTQNSFEHWEFGPIFHVEVDAHNCAPVLLDNIIGECYAKVEECKDML